MENFKSALKALTVEICNQFSGMEIPSRPIWTVVTTPGSPPHVALDPERAAFSDLRFHLTIGLLNLPEYAALAEVAEQDSSLRDGVIIDAGGVLHPPERTNLTRALATNFLWRYLGEGRELDWDESRFDKSFDDLEVELTKKSVVVHTTLPLSNLKLDIDALDFDDDFQLLPASIEELEQWLNPDRSLPTLGIGPPQWDGRYVDRPAVLHARGLVVGRLPPADVHDSEVQFPRSNPDDVISALRLILNAPISIILEESDTEGLMGFGGRSMRWGMSIPTTWLPIATLDKAASSRVTHVWKRLKMGVNSERSKLSLRRWESSILRANLEDQLVDAWIGLEALLIGDQRGEVAYRAALRLAELLGKDGNDRNSIYDAARFSYTWRSAIVHGSSTNKLAKKQSLAATVDVTAGYLRLALLRVLDLTSKFDPNRLESELLTREVQAQ